jgi:hypothetical protein
MRYVAAMRCVTTACEHPLLAHATDTDALSLDSKTGKPLRFSTAITAGVVEITKLVHGAGTIKPVHVPSEKTTCCDRVVKEKMQANAATRRVRGTAGGDKIDSPCSVSSSTASMTCVKMLCNGAVSYSDSNLGSADATDFCLGADLPSPQSTKIYRTAALLTLKLCVALVSPLV